MRARLRLHHHADGARVAYREIGTGPPLCLLHAAGLSHREWEPVCDDLARRFRVVLPDLPLHGDSEDRPHHPYTLDWLAEVVAGFARDVLGPRPLVAGHELGAEVLLRATGRGLLAPGRLVLMPTRLHRRPQSALPLRRLRPLVRAGGLPGANRLAGHAARGAWRPKAAEGLIARADGAAGARDLLRHATADIGGNADLARSWSRFARSWPPRSSEREVLTILRELRCPTLLLWADEDALHPVEGAREALDLLRDGQLRVLDRTGFLLSYDDPVGVARELVAFCG